MELTVFDFKHLIVDASIQRVVLYDINSDDSKIIFDGILDEVPDEYDNVWIASIDNVFSGSEFIGLNVDVE